MNIENEKHTLESLLKTVRDQSARKVDYVAQTDSLKVRTDGFTKETQVFLEGVRGEPTKILTANGVAFDQMVTKAGLDVRTGRRLQQEYPDVLDHALNRIHTQESRSAMLRTFDGDIPAAGFGDATHGTLRAVVSDKFKTFDNPDLLESVLPTLIESDADWEIVNAAVTAHLTSSRSDGDTWAMLTDESKRLDNAALSSKLKDITAAYASRDMFESVLEQFRLAAGDIVENGMAAAQPAVNALGGILKLSKAETSSVLDGLMQTIQQDGYRGEPLSRATMVNAVTAAAHKADADSVSDWQVLGGKVLDLPANQWQAIASVPVAVAA